MSRAVLVSQRSAGSPNIGGIMSFERDLPATICEASVPHSSQRSGDAHPGARRLERR